MFTYSDASTSSNVAPAPGYLIKVQDQFGRSVGFEYQVPAGGSPTIDGRIAKIVDPSGQPVQVAYVGSGLASLRWQDLALRQFNYDHPLHPWALTGVVDENGNGFSTFGYDSAGRAISTERAGGVDRFSVTYAQPPAVATVDVYDEVADVVLRTRSWQSPTGVLLSLPTGAAGAMTASGLHGAPHLTGQLQSAGSGCAASSSAIAYDANANVASSDDFNDNRSCYAHDLARNLETTRVEGLSTSAVCSAVTGQGVSLPTGSRKTSTQWHPDWRLESRKAEPGRITTSIHNGQPDPFNGNAIASCAPASALLPDGKPIAVLCKQVEQATMDANGALGFVAVLDASTAPRVQSWTYNEFGQMLTHDGPRTDVSDVTTYTYYSTTTADHTKGDLQSMTNALGKTTQYTKYNPHGQLLQSVDPNGVVTVNTYDLRQRLLSTTAGGLSTSFIYDPAGQLTRVTQPDGSYVGYEYDAAHRQTALFDSLGNRIEYTLDNAGNRTAERIKDPTGVLRRQRAWSIDALGRVQQATGE
ncbi:MAG: RHS repeat protein [Rubrivivax sp.]